MKTKTRETSVDTELVDRINEIRDEQAIQYVESAVREQANINDSKASGGGMMLRAAWATLKQKLTSNQKTNG